MHSGKEMACHVLSDVQRKQFVHHGFVKFEGAFPGETAAEAREILWHAVGFNADDRRTWTRPVVRLGDFAQKPFRQAVNNELLHAAFDEIVGVGRWLPRASLGGFVVRFPHPDDPGDTGWHLDASFPSNRADEPPPGSLFEWRINVRSRGRALLMLFCSRMSARETRRRESGWDRICGSLGCWLQREKVVCPCWKCPD